MPSLSSSNDLSAQVQVTTVADGSGIQDTKSGLQDLSKTGDETGKTFSDFADKFSDNMKKTSIVTGLIGAGLTAYGKSASDTLVGLVKDSKALATQTGMTTIQSSELLAAFQHMGIQSSDTSIAFRKLSVDITHQREGAADLALQHDALNNKIQSTKLQITELTDNMNKNGDSTGKIANQIAGLNINLKSYEKQLSDTTGPLDKLHVSTQNADGSNKSFNDILMNVADRFKELPDGAQKTAAAIDVFGRSGGTMVKVLNLGSDGIMKLESDAKKLGLTLTQENIVAVQKFVSSQKDLAASSEALKLQVGQLVTPVLTNFNLKLNQLATAALAPGSPIRGLTVDVLAFGGPILGAASGVAAFLGNVASALPALNALKNAFTGVIALLQSPWVIAIAAAAIGIGLLAEAIMHSKTQAENLTVAQNNLRQATLDLKTAQDSLKQSLLDQEGASLAVEGAQRNYNQAVNDFGPNSYEARDALYNLKQAQENLAKAQDATKDSQQKLLDKQKEVAKDQALIKHLQEVKDNMDGITTSADGAVTSINKLATNIQTNNAVGQKLDLTPLLKKKAMGGPVTAGTPYIVGDNPDGSINSTSEVFIPNSSGTILPADKTRQLLSGRGSASMTNIFHVYNNTDVTAALNVLAWRLAAK